MAPSSGHVLVPKVLNAFKYAVSKTAQAVRARLTQAQPASAAQPIAIPVRSGGRHAVHPLAVLKQSRAQHRSFSTSIRRVLADTYPVLHSSTPRRIPRASFPVSKTSTLIGRTPGAATFASTLRPNLTGGALPRTAGGYGVGVGGRRMFSHVPGAQAQVVQNVSSAVRAFWLGGQRGRFDGMDQHTGEKRFVAIGKREDELARKMGAASVWGDVRGTSLEFCVVPELNAIKGNEGKMELSKVVTPLATDFARSLGALAAVHRDLKKLATLGDLPVSEPRHGWIAVRFPGCDGRTVERLCDELGLSRGLVREDDAWAEENAQDVKMALLFPTAPSEGVEDDDNADDYFYQRMPTTPSLPQGTTIDANSYTVETLSSLESAHISNEHSFDHITPPRSVLSWQSNLWDEEVQSEQESPHVQAGTEYLPRTSGQDLESICRFLAECDERARL